MRSALKWYVVWNGVALVVVVLGVVGFSGAIARQEALRDAERTAREVADALVVPLADAGFHARDADALARMTEAMEYRSRDGSITHIKVWEDAGGGRARILWASDRRLAGRTFEMGTEEYSLFGTHGMVASPADLTKDENEFERNDGALIEVYTGTRDAAGVPIVFEVYISSAGLSQDVRALVAEILPLPLGALIVLSLASLPLAVSLAHRVDRGQQQMQRLLVNAVASSDIERRRIAQDLHDGVVQDLAGIAYTLDSGAQRLPEGEPLRGHIEQAGDILRGDLAALRTLMTDIYPPNLNDEGLADALRDLCTHHSLDSESLRLEIDEPLTPQPLAARLVYRAIREALGNVAEHACASSVVVTVGQADEVLHFEVVDDGVGFDPTTPGPEGHLGLRLISEMITDAGGRLTVESRAGAGTSLRGALPL